MDDISDLRVAVSEFCAWCEALPAAARIEKAWGPKEVLAHLLFWLDGYRQQLAAQLEEKLVEVAQGSFADINELAVTDSRSAAFEALLARYQAVSQQVCELAEELDLDSTTLILKKGSPARPLRWFIRGEAGHIRSHHRLLRQQLERDPVGRGQRAATSGSGVHPGS